MSNLMDELPVLIISALLIVLIGALLIARVITPDNTIFVVGSGSILSFIVFYWLGNGIARLSHAQTMRAAQVQLPPAQIGEILQTLETTKPTASKLPPTPEPDDHATQPMLVAAPAPDETTQPHV